MDVLLGCAWELESEHFSRAGIPWLPCSCPGCVSLIKGKGPKDASLWPALAKLEGLELLSARRAASVAVLLRGLQRAVSWLWGHSA